MLPAERAAYREHVTGWLTAHAVAATGTALAAALAGERHLPTLYRANAADGVARKTNTDGATLVGAVTEGDTLDGLGTVIAPPMRDPETGAFWLTVRAAEHTALMDDYDTAHATVRDVELAPTTVVTILPKRRTLAPWLAAALAEYRADHAAWTERREAYSHGYGTESREYVARMAQAGRPDPAPRYADYVREHAARNNEADHDAEHTAYEARETRTTAA